MLLCYTAVFMDSGQQEWHTWRACDFTALALYVVAGISGLRSQPGGRLGDFGTHSTSSEMITGLFLLEAKRPGRDTEVKHECSYTCANSPKLRLYKFWTLELIFQ